MSVKVIITIQNDRNNMQKIEAKSISDESSTKSEKEMAGWIHDVLTKILKQDSVYFEQRSDLL